MTTSKANVTERGRLDYSSAGRSSVGRRRVRAAFETLEDRRLLSAATLAAGADVNLTKMAGNQVTPQIAVDPLYPNVLVTVSQTDVSGGSAVVVSRSIDGGATWATSTLGAAQDGLPAGNPRPDARLAFDAFGNLYVCYMVAASATETRVIVARSGDGGATFPSVTAAVSGNFQPDTPVLATGVDPASPGTQVVYVAFLDYRSRQIMIDHALATGPGHFGSFSAPVAVSSSFGAYPSVAVDAGGKVAVAWQSTDAGVGPSQILYALDALGPGAGAAFSAARVVASTNVGGWEPIPAEPHRTIDAAPQIAFDRSGGPDAGRLFLAYTDAPAAGSTATDVVLLRSDDAGSTWSNPLRVGDATGASQFWPSLAVDPVSGDVGVCWYDARNIAAGTAVDLYASISTDHGQSFLANVRVSGGSSDQGRAKYAAGPMGVLDLGDGTSSAFYNGKLMPVWADNSDSTGDNPDPANFDLYTASVKVTLPPTPPPNPTPTPTPSPTPSLPSGEDGHGDSKGGDGEGDDGNPGDGGSQSAGGDNGRGKGGNQHSAAGKGSHPKAKSHKHAPRHGKPASRPKGHKHGGG